MEVDDFLPLSGLQHLLFCERQCALIHVERLWSDNHLTVEGNHLHERADKPGGESRPGVRVARRLPLRSDRLKLVGFADVVEFHATPNGEIPFPVEYKRGKRHRWLHDEVQVCAQAICIEEALGLEVPKGALFYGASRRRLDVDFTDNLRAETEAAARRYHDIVRDRITPRAAYEKKCDHCSLFDVCLPRQTHAAAAGDYLKRLMEGEA